MYWVALAAEKSVSWVTQQTVNHNVLLFMVIGKVNLHVREFHVLSDW
jgi:hypothetical protein